MELTEEGLFPGRQTFSQCDGGISKQLRQEEQPLGADLRTLRTECSSRLRMRPGFSGRV